MRAIFHRIIICVGLSIALFLFVPKVEASEVPGRIVGQQQFFNGAVQGAVNLGGTSSVLLNKSFDYSVNGTSIFNSYKGSDNSDNQNGVFLVFRMETYILDTQSNLEIPDYNFSVVLKSSGEWVSCLTGSNFVVCPLQSSTGTLQELRIYSPVDAYTKLYTNVILDYRINNFADIYIMDNFNNYLYGISSWLSRIYSNMGHSDITNAINQQTQDLQNSDANASATYNNDYSTQSYDQAESSVNSSMDVDVSNFVFNPSQWIYAFNWIWQTLTSFVQINGKVFATITSFLTFSFVGLVIGRS